MVLSVHLCSAELTRRVAAGYGVAPWGILDDIHARLWLSPPHWNSVAVAHVPPQRVHQGLETEGGMCNASTVEGLK